MSDLIKRTDAIKAVEDGMCTFYDCDVLDRIKTIPSADRPSGEWKFVGSSIEMIWECPFCGEHTFGFEEHLPNYCSNCGADMRKGVNV